MGLLAACLALSSVHLASADTRTWIAGGGNWSNDTNWDTIAPLQTDGALFNQNATYNVTLFSNETINDFALSDGNVSLFSSSISDTRTLTINDPSGDRDLDVTGGSLTLGDATSLLAPMLVFVDDQVRVEGNGVLNVVDGSSLVASTTSLGVTGDGTLIVDGAGSSLFVSSNDSYNIGANGNTGTLRVQNSATADLFGAFVAGVRLGVSTNGSDGNIEVESGGTLNTGSLLMATTNSTAGANVLVTGSGSTMTQLGGVDLTVGSPSGGAGTITVESGGTFTTGTGTTTINDTGILSITDGTFNASGTLTMSAGSTVTLDGGALNAAAGLDNSVEGTLDFHDGTLAVSGGAFVPQAGGSLGIYTIEGAAADDLPHLVISGTATADLGGSISVGNDQPGQLTINGGADVTSSGGTIGKVGGAEGAATVSGAGSRWDSDSSIGVRSGSLTIEDGGRVTSLNFPTFGGSVGGSSFVTVSGANSEFQSNNILLVGHGGDSVVKVEDGGRVSVGLSLIGAVFGGSSVITVTGDDSEWRSSGIERGGAFGIDGTPADMTVRDDGLINADLITMYPLGTLTIDGGHVITDDLDMSLGGTLNFLAGSLTFNPGIEVGTGGDFPQSPSLGFGQELVTPGTTTIDAFREVSIDGGTFETADLAGDGTVQLNSGTLRITGAGGMSIGAGGPLGASPIVGSGQNLDITNVLTIDAAASLSLETGGNVSAAGVANNGIIGGRGTIAATLMNNSNGQVRAFVTDQLRLTAAGNTNAGQMSLFGGAVEFTQDLTNQSSGFISGNGTLIATGGLVNDGTMNFSATANLSGDVTNNATGLIISSGGTTTFFDDVVNNGEIRTSANSFTVYFGSYSGNGDTGTGTVIVEGDLKPGSSPGLMAFGGNVSFSPAADLEVEINGLLAGSEFDQITVAASATLAGALNVVIDPMFDPQPGDAFTIMTYTSHNGEFDSISGLGLVGDAFLAPIYDPTELRIVAMLPGDGNADGMVNGLDYLLWAANFGDNPADDPPGAPGNGDYNDDGKVDGLDYLVWAGNFGGHVATSVPEPATFSLLMFGCAAVAISRRRDQKW